MDDAVFALLGGGGFGGFCAGFAGLDVTSGLADSVLCGFEGTSLTPDFGSIGLVEGTGGGFCIGFLVDDNDWISFPTGFFPKATVEGPDEGAAFPELDEDEDDFDCVEPLEDEVEEDFDETDDLAEEAEPTDLLDILELLEADE